MTGPEHYQAAERSLNNAYTSFDSGQRELAQADLAIAQVHATLALAAANVNSDHWSEDYAAWDKVIGKPPGGAS